MQCPLNVVIYNVACGFSLTWIYYLWFIIQHFTKPMFPFYPPFWLPASQRRLRFPVLNVIQLNFKDKGMKNDFRYIDDAVNNQDLKRVYLEKSNVAQQSIPISHRGNKLLLSIYCVNNITSKYFLWRWN